MKIHHFGPKRLFRLFALIRQLLQLCTGRKWQMEQISCAVNELTCCQIIRAADNFRRKQLAFRFDVQ